MLPAPVLTVTTRGSALAVGAPRIIVVTPRAAAAAAVLIVTLMSFLRCWFGRNDQNFGALAARSRKVSPAVPERHSFAASLHGKLARWASTQPKIIVTRPLEAHIDAARQNVTALCQK